MNGAEFLLKCLENQGVNKVFGYPGGAVIDIYDALTSTSLEHVLVRHEQAAVHAADGYARSSTEVGVCFATAGPGAANLVSGIATAYMDSVPLVIFTGQVGQKQLGSDAFQEADITGITMPITKHSYLVKDIKEIPRIVKEAFHIASTGRPQPVLVDITRDVLKDDIDRVETRIEQAEINLTGYKPNYKGHPLQVKKAAKMLEKAERPVIIAGGGVRLAQATEELKELSEKLEIPVATTLMGLSAYLRDHELSVGFMGMHGSVSANMAVSEADVVMAVGVRFSDRTFGSFEKFQQGKQVIHVDIDPAEVDKNVAADIPIVGDAKNILSALLSKTTPVSRPEWKQKINDTWKKEDVELQEAHAHGLTPHALIKAIADRYEEAAKKVFVVTDVGQHQMWVAQSFHNLKPGSFLTSGGLGTMGYGFPAAIGAQLANPDADVLGFVGDGSFQMNLQELATVKKYNLPVKIIIMNNNSLGMVRQWQELFYKKNYSQVEMDANPDFAKVAEAYDLPGITLDQADKLDHVVEAITTTSGPLIVEVKLCTHENVFPFVPPGKGLTEMIKEGM